MFTRRFCRLCLWNDPKLVRLKEEENQNDDSLFHKIEYCLDTKISKDDTHSSYVCPKCVHKIDLFYVFKTNCKRADKLQKSSKNSVSHREQTTICTGTEDIQCMDSCAKRLCSGVNEQLHEECQSQNEMRLSHCPSVLKNSSPQEINKRDQCKNLSNKSCVFTAVEHSHDADKECELEEVEVFPAEEQVYTDESISSATALVRNTCSLGYNNFGLETPTLKYVDSSRERASDINEINRNADNILSNSVCVTNSCSSTISSEEVIWTSSSSEVTQYTIQQQVINNSLNAYNSDSVGQPFVLNVDLHSSGAWNELSSYENGAYNVIYITDLNDKEDKNNFLHHSDQVFYAKATLYHAFLHDLPLQTVLEGTTYVPPFSSSFIRCSYCEKLFSCMRSHVLHKSVCQKFFQCRHCRKKFVSKILRQLHYLNDCALKSVCHDHEYAQGQRCAVTEKTLMKLAKVHVHRLQFCTRCNNIFRTEDQLMIHVKTCQRNANHCKSLLRLPGRSESHDFFENSKLLSLNVNPVNNLKKESYKTVIKRRLTSSKIYSKYYMLRNNMSVKTRSAVSARSKTIFKRKDISESTSVLYAVGLVRKN